MSRTVWRVMGLLLVVGIVVTNFPRQTLACGCVIPPSPEEAFERADRVFSGIALPFRDGSTASFAAGPVWKEEAFGPMDVPVLEAHESGPCDFKFRSMQRYLVYAEEIDAGSGQTVATVCSGTGAIGESASTDLRGLERERALKRVADGGLFATLVAFVGWENLQWYRDRRSKPPTTPPDPPTP